MNVSRYLGELSLGVSALGVAALVLTGAVVLSDTYSIDPSSSPLLEPGVLSSVDRSVGAPSGSVPRAAEEPGAGTGSTGVPTTSATDAAQEPLPNRKDVALTPAAPADKPAKETRSEAEPRGWVTYIDEGSFRTVLPQTAEVYDDHTPSGERRREAFFTVDSGESYSLTSVEFVAEGDVDGHLSASADDLAGELNGSIEDLTLETVRGVRRARFRIRYPAGAMSVVTFHQAGEMAIFILLPPRNSEPTPESESDFDRIVEGFRPLR